MSARATLLAAALAAACAPSAPDPTERADERLPEARAALEAGDTAGARRLLEDRVAERPDDGRAQLLLGYAWHVQGEPERAIPCFEAALADESPFEDRDRAWYYLGRALFETGALARARTTLERHAELDEAEGDTRYLLGRIALAEERLDDALALFEAAARLNRAAVDAGQERRLSDVAKAHARLADVHRARGDLDSAARELERCVELWPAHFRAWRTLAEVSLERGDEERATTARLGYAEWKPGGPRR